jgi:hypothetical protein
MARLGGPLAVAPFATSETQSTTEYTGKLGVVFTDPDNPLNKYMLVDCQESFIVGEIVVVDGSGLATPISATSVGQVGMVVATVSGSDTAAWVQITGLLEDAICTSGVTTAAFLIGITTGGGSFDVLTSTEANVVYGGRAVTAASTATSPAHGGALADVLFGQGGAFVYGINTNAGTVS